MSKRELGQFYTKQYEKILDGMAIPDVDQVIEPFVGAGDLLNFVPSGIAIESYDIDPKCSSATKRDTLRNPPDYSGKFILTNPPYLARNKYEDKTLFDKYSTNDLYKCFLKSILGSGAAGGLIIIPLNFWCSVRKADRALRKGFLMEFAVSRVNVFEEQVFSDTTTTVCAVLFSCRDEDSPVGHVPLHFYPNPDIDNTLVLDLNEDNDWTIGGELWNLPHHSDISYKVSRLLLDGTPNTQINLKGLDDGRIGGEICLYISDEPYYGKKTSRTYATLVIEPEIDGEIQKWLVAKFNTFLDTQRRKYHSLFLPNYRESKDSARKRIPFDLVYRIVRYLLEHREI